MNIGIFGVGSFGEKHINVIKNISKINIVGFYDPDPLRSIMIEKKHNIKAFASELELINHCDAIDIVSSTEAHYNLINLGIQHKKHIFVEKPICCTDDEVEKLLIQNKTHNQVIQVGHIERYNPAIKLDFINKNEITEIKTKRTGIINERNKRSSLVLDLMIHDIDLIMQMIDSKIQSISSTQKKTNTSESIITNITFKNETKAQLIAERGVKVNNSREMILQLRDKKIEIDFINRTQKHTTQKMKQTELQLDINVNPVKMEFVEFYKNIINQTPPTVGTQEACQADSIALKIEQLSKSND